MKRYATVLLSLSLSALAPLTAYAAERSGDAEFLATAAKGSTAEVALGQMAETRAQNQRVREFGARMARDHQQALEQTQQAAGEAGIPLDPGMSPENEKLAEKLTRARGADFDRAYMQAMVENHKKTVARYEKQARQGDGKASQLAAKQLPVLKEHLAMAQSLSGELQPR